MHNGSPLAIRVFACSSLRRKRAERANSLVTDEWGMACATWRWKFNEPQSTESISRSFDNQLKYFVFACASNFLGFPIARCFMITSPIAHRKFNHHQRRRTKKALAQASTHLNLFSFSLLVEVVDFNDRPSRVAMWEGNQSRTRLKSFSIFFFGKKNCRR